MVPTYGPLPVLLSVAVTVKSYAPAAAGVPDRVPFDASARPDGRLPVVTA